MAGAFINISLNYARSLIRTARTGGRSCKSGAAEIEYISGLRHRTTEMSNEANNDKATTGTTPPSCAPSNVSDFTVALQNEYHHLMVAISMACRKSGGNLSAPDVVPLMAKADALDAVCELWGVNPND